MSLDLVSQIKSIMRFVEEQCPGIPLQTEKSQAATLAPALLAEHVRSQAAPMMATAQQDIAYWKITFFSPDYWASKKVIGDLKDAIQQLREIPACLFDFSFPAPTGATATDGHLPAGVYRLQVTGVGRDGAESLPSQPVDVTLAEPGSIRLTIPRLEHGVGPFVSYRVYLGGALAGEVEQDAVGNTSCQVADLPANHAAAPPDTSVLLERFFYVEDVQAVTFGERNELGLFEGIVRLKTRLTIPKRAVFAEKVAQVSAVVAATK
ncbi:hypothetical protein CIG75_03105 [Tumebacillus algifaecis]|uniref:Uncharacterized protein n=1 Tax=Tumebacillus algifaecis TaxID=1214604 RepID=A0A223CXH1_9BACL|nr:hypothetical protein [Tumebacillus algifaecis]ASS74070.1 hypothetical protein CIG75_03105 [Tumebacillus algifaecis]